MPDPLPILVLGRLAVDRKYHNQGFGTALLRDALLRAVNIARDAGVLAVLVHALHDGARHYLSRGFVPSRLQPMTLMVTIKGTRDGLMKPGDSASHS